MIVEITGTSVRNKGAELMFLAVQEHLQQTCPNAQLAVDFSFGSFEERARYGLSQKIHIKRFGRSKLALTLMPNSLKKAFGIVDDNDVDAILDASGFAFGDQHPLERMLDFAYQVEKWAKQGKPIILLPQALGPFTKPGYSEAFKRIVQAVDLVYARDQISYEYAVKATANTSKIKISPDFTNLVHVGKRIDSEKNSRVCVVPNQRMLEKATSKKERESYLSFLVSAVRLSLDMHLDPVFLLHGVDDDEIVDVICKELGVEITVIKENDPLLIKQIIGESYLVIGSRYHALVSALSQGVPTLATSWSHKYEKLFEDYGCLECIVPVNINKVELRNKIEMVMEPMRSNYLDIIREKGKKQVEKVKIMWDEVDDILNI